MDWIQVEGDSMRPFLFSGDRIAVEWSEPGQPASYRVGELVVGREAGESVLPHWIVHRVVHASLPSQILKIKGDAAFSWDLLTSEQIWGRVVTVQKQSKFTCHLSVNWADRCIAWLSRASMPPEKFSAKLTRRALFLMATLRRSLL